MKEALEFYQQQEFNAEGIPSWVMNLKAKGRELFHHMGLPTRQQEPWRYTSLDQFLKKRFEHVSVQTATQYKHFSSSETTLHKEELSGIPQIRLHQTMTAEGKYIPQIINSENGSLPSEVIVMPLAEALIAHEDKVRPYLDSIIQHQHGFHALNTAFLQVGTFVYVPSNMRLAIPIVLSHTVEAQQMFPLRHLVILEAGSEAIVVEDYQDYQAHETSDNHKDSKKGKTSENAEENCANDGASLINESSFTNALTEVMLGQDATLTHYKIQRENTEAYHLAHVAVRQSKGSHFQSHMLSLGSKLSRTEYHVQLVEAEAKCSLNGIYLPSKGQHMDQQSLICHEVAHCTSEQDYKGILMQGSRAVFAGKIRVEKYARQTTAKQQNKNLLLALNAEIDTQPQLEIFADDVVCTHGATVGQLDEEALFYLAARGIDKDQAKRYLIQGFIENNLRQIKQSDISPWLVSMIRQRLNEAL